MRILIVHRYYWPDVGAYPQMLQIMAQRFAAQGHQVTVFSTQPGYNDVATKTMPRQVVRDGVEEIRVSMFKENKKNFILRALNVFLFLAQLILHSITRFRRYDLITVGSFPPTVTAMVVRWISWINGCKYLYHCQDIYPEIAQASGMMKKNLLSKLVSRIDRRNCRRAEAVVTLSEDMVQTLSDRGLSRDNMHVINNFVIDRFDSAVEVDAAFQKDPGVFRVLFAGNLGRFQHLDEVLKSAISLKDIADIHFFFVGAGVLETRLKNLAKEAGVLDQTVFFRPFQPLQRIMRVIHDSDLAIVSLSPHVIRCAYPSKTMTYLESGCRILGLLEPESQLAQLIENRRLGSISKGLSADEIADAIRNEYELAQNAQNEKSRIQSIGQELFGQETILQKWDSLIQTLDQKQLAYNSN